MGVDAFTIIASSIAALTARICTHPIDTIKTRLQVANGPLPKYSRLMLFQQAVFVHPEWSRWHALRSLYSGLPVTLLFSVPALSVYLSCYEGTKTWLDSQGAVQRQSIMNHLLSGCAAEVAAGLLFTPMEVLKNRMQTQRDRGHASLAQSIWRREGLAGFFKGYWMGLAVFVPHTMAYFATYEKLKMWAAGANGNNTQLPLVSYVVCSSLASIVGITLSTPLDIVKTRWQISAGEEGRAFRLGPVAIAQHMWEHEGGWRAFGRGLAARTLWGIPTTAISMTVFECLKDWHSTAHSVKST